MNSNRFRRKFEIGRPNFNTRNIRSRKCLCVRWLLWLFLNQDRHSLGVGFKLSKSAPTRSVYGNKGLASLPQSAISAMRTRTRTRTRTRLPSEYCLWMDSEHFLPTFIVIGACIIISVGALKHCKSTQPTYLHLPPASPPHSTYSPSSNHDGGISGAELLFLSTHHLCRGHCGGVFLHCVRILRPPVRTLLEQRIVPLL